MATEDIKSTLLLFAMANHKICGARGKIFPQLVAEENDIQLSLLFCRQINNDRATLCSHQQNCCPFDERPILLCIGQSRL
jgi:hypothetical protein